MTYTLKLSATAATLAMAAFLTAAPQFSQPANAAIQCEGNYQIVKGIGSIATPYCQDNHLAKMAQKRGMKIGARSIRNNLSAREEACAAVGSSAEAACFAVGSSDG